MCVLQDDGKYFTTAKLLWHFMYSCLFSSHFRGGLAGGLPPHTSSCTSQSVIFSRIPTSKTKKILGLSKEKNAQSVYLEVYYLISKINKEYNT